MCSPLHVDKGQRRRFLFWALKGSGRGKIPWLCSLLVALTVNFFGIRADWDHEAIMQDIPLHSAVLPSRFAGLAPRSSWGITPPSTPPPSYKPRLEYDDTDFMAYAVAHHTWGVVLVVNFHIDPHALVRVGVPRAHRPKGCQPEGRHVPPEDHRKQGEPGYYIAKQRYCPHNLARVGNRVPHGP